MLLLLSAHLLLPQGVLLDQNNNLANPASHEATTGVEIWRQTNGKLTHFIAGMGTSGTLTGCARALKSRNASITCIGLEPPSEEPTGVPGIRRWPEQLRPKVRDDAVIDGVMGVSRREAEETARALARTEGLLLGVSAAGAVSAALRLAAGISNATIVVLACDRGDRYLSTGVFSAAAGAADPAPCPPSELASVVARVAAGAYGVGPHYLSFPAVAAAAAAAAAAADGCTTSAAAAAAAVAKLAAAEAQLASEGDSVKVICVTVVPNWHAPGMPPAAAAAAAVGDAPVVVRLVRGGAGGRISTQVLLSQQCMELEVV
jgi:hypothetical protein